MRNFHVATEGAVHNFRCEFSLTVVQPQYVSCPSSLPIGEMRMLRRVNPGLCLLVLRKKEGANTFFAVLEFVSFMA